MGMIRNFDFDHIKCIHYIKKLTSNPHILIQTFCSERQNFIEEMTQLREKVNINIEKGANLKNLNEKVTEESQHTVTTPESGAFRMRGRGSNPLDSKFSLRRPSSSTAQQNRELQKARIALARKLGYSE